MNALRKIKLTHRVAAILIGTLTVIFVNMFAGYQASQLAADETMELHDIRYEATAALGVMRRSYMANRMEILLMFQHAADSPMRDMHNHPLSVHADSIQRIKEENNAASKIVESRKMDEKELALVNDMLSKRKAWQTKRDAVMKAIADNDYSPEVMRDFIAAGNNEGNTFEASIVKLIEHQGKAAEFIQEEAAGTLESMKRLYLGSLVLVIAPIALFMVSTLNRIRKGFAKANKLANAIGNKVLNNEVHDDGGDEIAHLLKDMDAMQRNLRDMLSSILSQSDSIASSSAEVSTGTHDLSMRTEEQASALEQTASATNQLSEAIQRNAENAAHADKMAGNASLTAEKGGTVVAQVVSTMDSINASSRKIEDIIAVIDGIAFQTNILALNAAVEAARAGEVGRGFAVVASEVRSLAQRSASAAKEIKALIEDSVAKVSSGTSQANQAGQTMHEISSSIQQVTDLMRDIAKSSAEQAQGIKQINQAVSQMDGMTQQNAALVEEASAASSSLQDQARLLRAEVAQFTV